MAWMYILECCDGSYYVGSTRDLERRLFEHQEGLGSRYTAGRLPVKLVYCEEYERVDDAYFREKQVQGWRRVKREALINGNPELLPSLAKKIFRNIFFKDNRVVELGGVFPPVSKPPRQQVHFHAPLVSTPALAAGASVRPSKSTL